MASEGMPFGYGMDGDTNETNLYGSSGNCLEYGTGCLTFIAEILGIERNASKAEIKKAYHKVSDTFWPRHQ